MTSVDTSTHVLLPTASARRTRQAVRELLPGHRLLAAGALLTLVGGTAAGLVVPPIIGRVVDLVDDGRSPDAITAPVVVLVLAALVQAGLTGWGQVLTARLGETMLAVLRERVVRRVLGLPLAQVERAGSGDLVARVSGDTAVVGTAVRTAVPALAGAGLTVGLTLVALLALDWRFALAGVLAAPVQVTALRWYLRRTTPVFAQQRIAEGARTQQVLESIGGRRTVRAFDLTEEHIAAGAGRSLTARDLALTANRLATRFFGRLNAAEFIGLGTILAVGFVLVRANAASVGTATAAALYFHRVFDPINTLLGLFGTAQEAAAGTARLVGVAEAELPPPFDPPVPHDGSAVSMRDVDFAYTAGRPVLREVSLRVGRGEHVALVGASGAGKSTVAALIAGVHRPQRGELAVAGGERGAVLVTQEVHVFAGPLAEDLRLASPGADDAALADALDAVGATDWVATLPEGTATVVGEGGHRLTTTQAQQLALARLLLAAPELALLDEAGADAGSAGSRMLDTATGAALAGRSALVVAHRLSQAAAADRVVVMEAGRVVEQGPPAELVAAGGRYAALWRAWEAARTVG